MKMGSDWPVMAIWHENDFPNVGILATGVCHSAEFSWPLGDAGWSERESSRNQSKLGRFRSALVFLVG
jgi:hypothetical protein